MGEEINYNKFCFLNEIPFFYLSRVVGYQREQLSTPLSLFCNEKPIDLFRGVRSLHLIDAWN